MLDAPGQIEPLISVAICTRNRVRYVETAIDSVLSQVSEHAFELILVDNASTDGTARLVREKSVADSRVMYHHEARLGLSHARNLALAKARGRYIVFLDDDAVAEPGWISAIAEAFAAAGPEAGCVAGKVDPIWEAPRPSWLHDRLLSYLSLLDWSASPIRLDERQWVVGANLAFDKDALERVGGFSANLGRRGRNLLSNEEKLARLAIERLGYTAHFEPAMAARHLVPAERLHRAWFVRRAYYQGLSDALLNYIFGQVVGWPRFRQELGRTVRGLLRVKPLLYMVYDGGDPVRFQRACQSALRFGYLVGLLKVGWR